MRGTMTILVGSITVEYIGNRLAYIVGEFKRLAPVSSLRRLATASRALKKDEREQSLPISIQA